MSGFDFHALVANAPASLPDEHVFIAVQGMEEALTRWRRARSTAERRGFLREVQEAEAALVNARPGTAHGLLAKLKHANASLRKSPMLAVEFSALRDAVEWLEASQPMPQPPRNRRRKGRGG
jgi:hypothetical protein